MTACYAKVLAERRARIAARPIVKTVTWKQIEEAFANVQPRTFFGLTHPELRDYVREKRDFLYVDNGYLDRGARSTVFRLIRKGLHLTSILPEQKRAVSLPQLEPWRKGGKTIVVIPPSPYHVEIYQAYDWLATTLDTLSRVTARPVVVKYNKQLPLREFLADAHAVVTFSSVAGVEAAIWGYPVFAGDLCPALPVSAGRIEHIEYPRYPERHEWLRSLAYACWPASRIEEINLDDYAYKSRHDLSQTGA